MKTVTKYFIVNPDETLEASITDHGGFEGGYNSRSAAAMDRDVLCKADPKAKILEVSITSEVTK